MRKQEECILLFRPSRGVSKNFFVAFEGKDFPKVREALLDQGWSEDEPIETSSYYSAHMYAPNGSELFDKHTPAEKSKYIKQFKKIIADCGIETYYEQKFDFRDLL